LAGAFGGGGSQTSFGPRSSTNIMHRLTTGSFVLFVLLSLTLAIMQGRNRGRSTMDSVEASSPPVATQPGPAEVPVDLPVEAPADAPAEQP